MFSNDMWVLLVTVLGCNNWLLVLEFILITVTVIIYRGLQVFTRIYAILFLIILYVIAFLEVILVTNCTKMLLPVEE